MISMKIFLSLFIGILIGFCLSVVFLAASIKDELIEVTRTEIMPDLKDQYRREVTEAGDLWPLVKNLASQLDDKVDLLLNPDDRIKCTLLISAEKQAKQLSKLKSTLQRYEIFKHSEFPNESLKRFESNFSSEQLAACNL